MHVLPNRRRATRRAVVRGSLAATAMATPIARKLQATPATPEADDVDTVFSELDELAARRMSELGIPGAAIGVIAGNQEHTAAFGVTSIDQPLPVDADTIFQIGSTTKTYTGTAIMRLVEQGTLDLDAPVQTWLPDFRVADPDVSRDVRLWHLLTHTAGWLDAGTPRTGRGDDALTGFVDSLADVSQVVPPGSRFSYNNSALAVAGRVIEAVTDQPYESAIAELVLQPLGLEHAGFFPEDIMTKSFAVGHADANGELTVVEPWGLERAMNPAGGLAASLNDELRYARFLLGDGTMDGTRLLSADTMTRVHSPLGPEGSVPSIPRHLDAVGVAWLLWTHGGERIISHPGGTEGQQSTFTLVPGRDFAITVLTNANTGVQFGNELTDWALERFLGLPLEPIETIPATPGLIADYSGTYAHPDQPDSIRVGEADGELRLEWQVPDQAPVTIPLILAVDDKAYVDYLGLTAPVDFVRDASGTVAWIRFIGRLVPKTA